nr:X-linked retinitis pigmentosa GTPase regulator-like [Nerophis lumbriciformis]
MAGEEEDEIPESGAVFTFGKSKFADNLPCKFWLKNDIPRKIACGDEHTALITENGKLFMFGSNNWGQLGLGSKVTVNKPTCVKALKSQNVQLVACGRNHTLICTAQGHVYATGGNSEGQLGLGDCDERTSFQKLEFFDSRGPIRMLAAGSNTSAALTESGELFMWGDNSEGQVGLGKESHACSPQEVSAGQPIAWVSCGYYHSAYVTEDGALYTFGERDSGKLGLGTDQLARHRVPQLVKSMPEPVTQVACGGGHTVAVTENGVYAFGLGQFGQLGLGTFIFESRLPRLIEHFKKDRVRQVACGENHSAVITDSGLLYTFGDGRHGKLGLSEENFTNQFKPTLCPRFIKCQVQEVFCGGCHMVVLALPRSAKSGVALLEDCDVTEDYLEKPYVELLGDVGDTSNPARVRRREREKSPEVFGDVSCTLQTTTSGYLQPSTPVSSHNTLPSLSSSELTHRKVLHSAHRHGNNEASTDQADDVVESLSDTDSVKGLGETTDLLNMTHVMKMDPNDKTLMLSPVHKKKGKNGKALTNQKEKPLKDRKLSERSGCPPTSPSRNCDAAAARKATGAHDQKMTKQNKENHITAPKDNDKRPEDPKKTTLQPSPSRSKQRNANKKLQAEHKTASKQCKGKPTGVTRQPSDFSLSDACDLNTQQRAAGKTKSKKISSKDHKTSKNEKNKKEAESKNEEAPSSHLLAGAASILQEVAAFSMPSLSESSHHSTTADSNPSAMSMSSSPSTERGKKKVKDEEEDVRDDQTIADTEEEEEDQVRKVTSASEEEEETQTSEKVTEEDDSDTLKPEDKSATDEGEEDESEEEEEEKTVQRESEDEEKESKEESFEEETAKREEESSMESEGEEDEEELEEDGSEEEGEEEDSKGSGEEEEEEGESSDEAESEEETEEGEDEEAEEEEEENEEEEEENEESGGEEESEEVESEEEEEEEVESEEEGDEEEEEVESEEEGDEEEEEESEEEEKDSEDEEEEDEEEEQEDDFTQTDSESEEDEDDSDEDDYDKEDDTKVVSVQKLEETQQVVGPPLEECAFGEEPRKETPALVNDEARVSAEEKALGGNQPAIGKTDIATLSQSGSSKSKVQI